MKKDGIIFEAKGAAKLGTENHMSSKQANSGTASITEALYSDQPITDLGNNDSAISEFQITEKVTFTKFDFGIKIKDILGHQLPVGLEFKHSVRNKERSLIIKRK